MTPDHSDDCTQILQSKATQRILLHCCLSF